MIFEVNDIIKNIAAKTKLPLKKVGEGLDLTPSELMKQISGQKNIVSLKDLNRFTKKYGLNSDDLIQGSFDGALFRKRILGEQGDLPDRYDIAKFSRVRTTANIVEYLKFTRGWDFTEKLIGKHNLHISLFDNLTEQINILFFLDLLKDLQSNNISTEEFRYMAYHSAIQNLNTPLGLLLSKTKSNRELYRVFGENTALYDSNFNYKLLIESNSASLFIREKEQLKDELKLLRVGERNLCLYRHFLFSSLPIYRRQIPLPIEEHKCLYLGDDHCHFSVHLNEPEIRLL